MSHTNTLTTSSFLADATAGEPRRMRRAIALSLLSNTINVLPFAVVIHAVHLLFAAHSGEPLNLQALWLCALALVLFMAPIFWAERLAYRACYRDAYEVSASGRLALAEHLRRLPLGFLRRRDGGDLSAMLMGDFALIEQALSHFLPQLFGALVLPLVGIAALAFLDWRLALALFAALPAAFALLLVATRLVARLGDRHQQAKIDAGNRLQEYLRGMRVIKAHNLVGTRFERLETAFRALMRESILIEGLVGPFVLLAIACARIGLTLVVVVGVYLLAGGELDPLIFVTFLIVGARLFDPLTAAAVNFAELRYASRAGARIRALKAEPIQGGTEATPEGGDMAFRNVTFAYEPGRPVLQNVSIDIPQGRMTALVGPSGSGKSTLLKLVARFHDADEGAVTLGGRPLAALDPEALLERLSMVFQDVYLFRDTIAENIAFGRPGAPRAEIVEAAKKACCHEFVSRLPQGYDTPVGEGGCTLSGGERQRISIARAFLKDAPVLLLDEATAALDPENELALQRAIDGLVAGRTVLVVAHRLKTIRRADNIVVLDRGAVVAQGRHDDLIARGGLYAHLWEIQEKARGWRLKRREVTAEAN